jgi:hypothetical protein
MLLPVALFALFTVGFCVPCLLDVAGTPRYEVRSLTKGIWLLLIAGFWVFGAAAWLLAGRPAGRRMPLLQRDTARPTGLTPEEALRRHPAGRAAETDDEAGPDGTAGLAPAWQLLPLGPDDDPPFLLELERQIRQAREDWLRPSRLAVVMSPGLTRSA